MTDKRKTSSQAASILGISRPHLIVIISRHEHLRPRKKVQVGAISAFLWTDEEIESVRQYLQSIGSVSGNQESE